MQLLRRPLRVKSMLRSQNVSRAEKLSQKVEGVERNLHSLYEKFEPIAIYSDKSNVW